MAVIIPPEQKRDEFIDISIGKKLQKLSRNKLECMNYPNSRTEAAPCAGEDTDKEDKLQTTSKPTEAKKHLTEKTENPKELQKCDVESQQSPKVAKRNQRQIANKLLILMVFLSICFTSSASPTPNILRRNQREIKSAHPAHPAHPAQPAQPAQPAHPAQPAQPAHKSQQDHNSESPTVCQKSLEIPNTSAVIRDTKTLSLYLLGRTEICPQKGFIADDYCYCFTNNTFVSIFGLMTGNGTCPEFFLEYGNGEDYRDLIQLTQEDQSIFAHLLIGSSVAGNSTGLLPILSTDFPVEGNIRHVVVVGLAIGFVVLLIAIFICYWKKKESFNCCKREAEGNEHVI